MSGERAAESIMQRSWVEIGKSLSGTPNSFSKSANSFDMLMDDSEQDEEEEDP